MSHAHNLVFCAHNLVPHAHNLVPHAHNLVSCSQFSLFTNWRDDIVSMRNSSVDGLLKTQKRLSSTYPRAYRQQNLSNQFTVNT